MEDFPSLSDLHQKLRSLWVDFSQNMIKDSNFREHNASFRSISHYIQDTWYKRISADLVSFKDARGPNPKTYIPRKYLTSSLLTDSHLPELIFICYLY